VIFTETSAASSQDERIAAAIRRAQGNLMHLQHPDGYWCGELFVDATLCADYVAYMHWAGEIDTVLQEKCAAHVRRRQLPDGGWNIYENGPSELNASVKAYFALKLAGHAPTQPYMQEARACILRLGGIPRMNTYAKLYLALLGQFPWKYLPTVPAEMIFFPSWLFFHIHAMSSWSRAMLMPLAILNHYKPTRQLPADKQLHELYPVGTEQGELWIDWRKPRLSWSNFFLVCDSILKLLHKIPWKPWRQRAIRRCEEWMVEHMGEESDGLAAIFPAMLNGMIALKALGYSNDHPVLAKAVRDFEGLFVDDPQDFRIQPCLSPVWDSAINLVALLESGVDPQREEIRKAITWLESKEVRQRGDWCVNNPGVEPSGWAFEFNNGFYPDTDDTMMVLAALARAKTAERNAAEPAKMPFDRPLNWLLSFQCKDGGWAAFDKGVTERWLEDVPFADHNAILDPTCSDLTGRMLELLGYLGWQQSSRAVRRAIVYLRDTQETDGSWYGRWGVNYVYGTWQVLRGLHAIGEDMRQDWILRARDWLASCQNEDGGWGETCASYDDPTLKGKGPSTASQTAWAVMGLIAAADRSDSNGLHSKPILRGIEYLVSTQNADGSWTEGETTGTGFPRVFYLRYDMYRNNWPLLALATWSNAQKASQPS
jgi:squalene-hopene/tetraprenyl-beta-curcumene cyclase